MRRMFLMSSVLLAAPFFAESVRAEVCIADEDCNNLGYTEDKACSDGLKCPFGEKWHCPDKKCQIGWILNSDMSCTENVESGKTPIGVIVAIKDDNGWAMTASPIGKSVWSTMNNSTGAFQTTNWEEAIKDYNACDNTQKILQAGNSKIYPTAWAVAEYAPNGASGTKGKWCLPSAGIFNSLYTNLNVVNNGISKLGGTQLSNDKENIWSSTEYQYSSMWLFSTGRTASYQGGIIISMNNTNSVRPVIEFNIDTGTVVCRPLPDETGCTNGTETVDDGCGGTRKVCKKCTPTCANSPSWCQSSSYELVETGKDQCGNVCRQCCTTYTDTITDSYCFYGTDSSTQLKHCSSFSTSDNKSWILAVPTKRTYSDGTVKNLKSCIAPSFSTEEMCNFKKKAYPIGSSTQHQDCRGY
ncbi:MAG: hypothetical protein Q4F75_04015 [Pseudomonadota bacterium]|nr:hypothetical protein [Pseudomonadota bacterium]